MSRKSVEPPKIELNKSIFAAEYKPEIIFFKLMNSAAEAFPEYKDWQTNALSFTLHDYIHRCSVVISSGKFTYSQDSNDDNMEEKNIEKVIDSLPEALKLSSYNRLGYRRKYLIPVKMTFNELVTILNIKLYSQKPELTKILPSNIDDLLYRFFASDGDFRYRITVGPVEKKEIPQNIAFNQDLHLNPENRDDDYRSIIDKYPDVSVFIDFDIYRKEDSIPREEISLFWKEAKKRSEVTNK